MKKIIVGILAFIITYIILFPSQDVNATYEIKSNGEECFYLSFGVSDAHLGSGYAEDADRDKGKHFRVQNTQTVCQGYNDKNKVRVDNLNIFNSPMQSPNLDSDVLWGLDTDQITVKYCTNGPISSYRQGDKCEKVEQEIFIRSSYGSFREFAEAIHSFCAAHLGTSGKYTLYPLDENDAVEKYDDVVGNGGSNDGGDDGGGIIAEALDTCENQGGVKSLGWIICPILKILSDASDNIYEEIVEPSLRVDPKLFSDGNQGVKMAWETFRNIANIIFVILLLLVIFSQLTGVGIDNYGIKKILPKLIVAAILINLSYVLCVLAVDISNILGNSFQALFSGLADQLPDPQGLDIESDVGTTHIELGGVWGVLSSVGIIVAIVSAFGAIWQNPAIILSLLVSALGIFISIVFLFVMLATREAAVVVLTAVSPVAMVCYLLPNTKSLFDKWLKGFKGLLLVYPICGLLVGGGDYVAKLIMTAGFGGRTGFAGFTAAFTAMIAGIVPIFFIPMVLRNSFNALGNLGATISNVGRGASRGATRRARESGFYKNTQASGLERQTRIRGGLDANGNPVTGFRRGLGTVLSGGRMSRRRNALQYQKMLSERGSLEATEGEDFMLNTQASNILKEIEANGIINDDEELEKRLNAALVRNDKPSIKAYQDALSAKGESGRGRVESAYNDVVKRGLMTQGAHDAFKNNILANHAAEYKDNRRSLFETISSDKKDENGNRVFQTTRQYAESAEGRAKLMAKAKAGTLGAMDDDEFKQTFLDGNGEVNLDSLVDNDERWALGENAFNALKNAQNMDTTRVKYLQDIVKMTGYKASPQDVRIVEGNAGSTGAPTPGPQRGGGEPHDIDQSTWD